MRVRLNQIVLEVMGMFSRQCKFLHLLSSFVFTLMVLLAAPLTAQAQDKVLFVSTDETSVGWTAYIAHARAAFQSVAPAGTFVDRTGYLSGSTSLAADIADAKMLIVVTVCSSTPPPDRWNEVFSALSTRPDLLVLAFIDGSTFQTCPANLATFTSAINSIKPDSWPTITGTPTAGPVNAQLNQTSLYKDKFLATLPTIQGDVWGRVSPVPSDYALYTASVVSAPAPATLSDTYGLFIPQAASNKGQGACLFFVGDATQFATSPQPAQSNAIAQTFYTAATDPAGACKQAAADVPDLSPKLSGLNSLEVGVPADVILTVTNADQLGSTDGQVDVTLPAGISLVSPPAGCTPTGSPATGFSCPLSAIAANGNVTLPFQINATMPVSNVVITAVVSSVTGEVNMANNSTTLLVSAPGYPDLVSTITGSTTLNVGASGTYTVTVTNQGNLDSNDGVVNVTLPAGLALDPTSLPPYCTATATGFTCTLTGIPQGSNTTIPFVAQATSVFSNQAIQVQVTTVSGEQMTANNNSTMTLSATAEPQQPSAAQPVPLLNEWALASLVLLMTVVAVRARYRQPKK